MWLDIFGSEVDLSQIFDLTLAAGFPLLAAVKQSFFDAHSVPQTPAKALNQMLWFGMEFQVNVRSAHVGTSRLYFDPYTLSCRRYWAPTLLNAWTMWKISVNIHTPVHIHICIKALYSTYIPIIAEQTVNDGNVWRIKLCKTYISVKFMDEQTGLKHQSINISQLLTRCLLNTLNPEITCAVFWILYLDGDPCSI